MLHIHPRMFRIVIHLEHDFGLFDTCIMLSVPVHKKHVFQFIRILFIAFINTL